MDAHSLHILIGDPTVGSICETLDLLERLSDTQQLLPSIGRLQSRTSLVPVSSILVTQQMIQVRPSQGEDEVDSGTVAESFYQLHDMVVLESLNIFDVRLFKIGKWLPFSDLLSRKSRRGLDVLDL